MSRRIQQYIQRAHRRVNEEHLNFIDDDLYFAPQDNMFYADGTSQGAPVAAPAAPVKKSQPYIITVSSASGSSISNFNVLGYSLYYNNPTVTFTANGSLVNGAVTLSSGVANATYRDLLQQSQDNPFTAGLTYIYASSPAAQALTPFTVTTFDANGSLVSIPMTPIFDLYQQLTNAVAVEQEYRVDSKTYLTFSSILPNAVFNIYIYPSNNYNPARNIAGMQDIRNYGNPGIIRKSTAVLPGGTMIKSRLGS